ncbi:4-hydroxy-tetrahydrodipicolinate reductase [Planctellipticum variicoloris]|uniref:4-hydroxy-tetrahydrodipicolinate reductase n=1 Tax=Planctellipticum variicoloris TaxID=3064265 RepID=UPI002B947E9C|nr:4-hydroxy-tetrahydrodipicolinate reductase [Planctomycetaceae bacterium SH412]HTN01653.1 4-hydroxy-tetrahydrodipicolinate reductase [Planctomycetaceae bacterium]
MLKVGVNGAAGRMGQRVVALAVQDHGLKVVAAYEAENSPRLGQDAGVLAGIGPIGVLVTSDVGEAPDVIIDFSVPDGAVRIAGICEARRIPLVVATTGLSAEQKDVILTASQVAPVLMAPSMSLSVNIAMKLVAEAGRVLRDQPNGVDVEIIERHHRYKEDAPSGTALKFGEIVAGVMGQTEHIHGRHGRPGKRPPTEIAYHALRVGDNVGEHTIVFGMPGETLEVTVRGQSRDSYAVGALTAAKYIVTKSAGLYSMNDALGL